MSPISPQELRIWTCYKNKVKVRTRMRTRTMASNITKLSHRHCKLVNESTVNIFLKLESWIVMGGLKGWSKDRFLVPMRRRSFPLPRMWILDDDAGWIRDFTFPQRLSKGWEGTMISVMVLRPPYLY